MEGLVSREVKGRWASEADRGGHVKDGGTVVQSMDNKSFHTVKHQQCELFISCCNVAIISKQEINLNPSCSCISVRTAHSS